MRNIEGNITRIMWHEVFSPDYYQIGYPTFAEVSEENEDDMWGDVKDAVRIMI